MSLLLFPLGSSFFSSHNMDSAVTPKTAEGYHPLRLIPYILLNLKRVISRQMIFK